MRPEVLILCCAECGSYYEPTLSCKSCGAAVRPTYYGAWTCPTCRACTLDGPLYEGPAVRFIAEATVSP